MIRRPLVLAAALALAALASSCAVHDAQDSLGPSVYDAPPAAESMPSAKIGLPPQYRVFHDELAEYGDWTLIEPYGWCFRPAVNFVAWRPYGQGWWEPSDSYGWIWNSNEPFGWITYHYGAWFYDRFQGWVWQPGPVWGPAWVAWAQIDDYIGWAPLAPVEMQDVPDSPDGIFQFVRAPQFVSSSISTQALYVRRLADTRGALRSIENIERVKGTAINRGPDEYTLRSLGAAVPTRVDDTRFRRASLPDGLALPDEAQLVRNSRRMIDVAAYELSQVRAGNVPNTPPPAPAPPPSTGSGTPRVKPAPTHAPNDTTHVKRPPMPRGGKPGGKPRPGTPADTTRG